MSNDPDTNDMQHIWQNQPSEQPRISLEDLRFKMNEFERKILRRNQREYIAGAVVIAVFGFYLWRFPALLLRVGSCLTIAGTLFMMYQLRRKASVRTAPAEMALQGCVDFQRRELERQRDALRSVFSWYLLPFIPGLCTFLFGLFQSTIRAEHALGQPSHTSAIAVSFVLLTTCVLGTFIAVWWLNRRAANNLQMQIDEIEGLARGPHQGSIGKTKF